MSADSLLPNTHKSWVQLWKITKKLIVKQNPNVWGGTENLSPKLSLRMKFSHFFKQHTARP